MPSKSRSTGEGAEIYHVTNILDKYSDHFRDYPLAWFLGSVK